MRGGKEHVGTLFAFCPIKCVCVCTQQYSLQTWFVPMYIRLSTSLRIKRQMAVHNGFHSTYL